MKQFFCSVDIDTEAGISIHQLNEALARVLTGSRIRNGFMVVRSMHTTTAIILNEYEERLLSDIGGFLRRLVPDDAPYLHNDIAARDCPPDEPENAHSHLMALLLGSSESIPVLQGQLGLGQWQSLMLVELDGPRKRRVSVQICGE